MPPPTINPSANAHSKETLLLRALWLKAAGATAPLRIPTASASAAKQLRLRFYNAVKAIRSGKEVEPRLLQAILDCSIRLDPDDHSTLSIGLREQNSPELKALEALLGTPMAGLKPPAEMEMEAGLDRLLQAYGPQGDGPQGDGGNPDQQPRPTRPTRPTRLMDDVFEGLPALPPGGRHTPYYNR